MTIETRRIVLAARPQGAPKASDFRLETEEIGAPRTAKYCCARSGCRSTPTCAGG